MGKKKFFYICNGNKENCKKTDCYKTGGMCEHTTDVRFAENYDSEPSQNELDHFENIDGSYWEVS